MLPQTSRHELKESAHLLVKKASSLGASLHPQTAEGVKKLLRSMNSYYSNLIEGQGTHPHDIDQALKNHYDERDLKKKNLQLLAVAHIETQIASEKFLDENPETSVSSSDFLRWIHREFYSRLPRTFLEAHYRDAVTRLSPGKFRDREVTIAGHHPPQAADLEKFMVRFHLAYSDRGLDPLDRIVACCAAHHRLAWIHPFLDGNGRVTRLFSDCFFLREGLGGLGLWTMSRGLARKRSEYYEHLSSADQPRRGDLDGRGALSDRSLGEFCEFFLATAIDQVDFMTTILSLENYEKRLARFMQILEDYFSVRKESFFLLRDLYVRGQVTRGEAARVMGVHERTSSSIVAALSKHDLVRSDTPKSALYLNFNPIFAYFMFPNLYPESIDFTKFLPGKR